MKDQRFDIGSIHNAYSNGVSAAQVIDECYRRIEEIGDPGIFIHLIAKDVVLNEVEELGELDLASKPLWGIPFAVKDNIDAANVPTTAACPAFEYVPEKDSFVVKLLRDAGAILIGKTNLDQFATGLVGIRSPYQPPKNAVDPEIIPGGSSSGSAVVVSHGIVSFALGTDTAGSGRVPAALNNIVGLKPSLGALSNSGVVPACRSLDSVSIFALTVENAYHVLRVSAKYDQADCYSKNNIFSELGLQPHSIRVGVPDAESLEFFGDTFQAESFKKSIKEMETIGCSIKTIDFKVFYEVAKLLYEGPWVAERFITIEKLLNERPEAFYPVTKKIIEPGGELTATDTFKSLYRLEELKREVEELFNGLEMLCVPTIPTFYTVSDLEEDPFLPNSRLGTYTNFVNLLDLCGISVPVHKRDDGRPGSVTILAPVKKDALVARVSGKLQQKCGATLGATGWMLPSPCPPSKTPFESEIELAVVGAHMSGLPFNNQLTDLGGRLLKQTKTAPSYKMYKLVDGPPHKPGMVFSEQGAAIELEVWALPISEFGKFMSSVTPPLCIGTLLLEDGSSVKGFLCESKGIVDAVEITKFGGWRAYLSSTMTNQ